MTTDQKIQVWIAIGGCISGIGTLAAVVTALFLARRVEKIRLKVEVGLRGIFTPGDGSPFQKHLGIFVTNLGERPVTVNSVVWVVGRGKKKRYAIQTVSGPHTSQCPVELAHGKTATFLVSFDVTKNWLEDFATGFIQDLSDESLKTLFAQVHTSVGETVNVRPETNLLDALRKVRGLKASSS